MKEPTFGEMKEPNIEEPKTKLDAASNSQHFRKPYFKDQIYERRPYYRFGQRPPRKMNCYRCTCNMCRPTFEERKNTKRISKSNKSVNKSIKSTKSVRKSEVKAD